MTEAKDLATHDTTNLLTHYSFDLSGYMVEQLIDRWLRTYPPVWLRAAVIEALYQGRYKAISVEQILSFWGRRGQPLQHFNHEFERIVCSKFPRNLNQVAEWEPIAPPVTTEPEVAIDLETDLEAVELESPEAIALPDRVSESSDAHPSIATENASDSDQAIAVEKNSPLSFDLTQETRSETHFIDRPAIDMIGASESIQPFKPDVDPSLDPSDLLLWSRGQAGQPPIHRFIPAPPTASDFYVKLKAVAQSEDHATFSTASFAVAEPQRQPGSSEVTHQG
jgi:hypothetical protein